MSLSNRVRAQTTTIGTGTVTLVDAAAAANYLSFSEAGVGSGSVVSYLIEEGGDFELGYGVFTSPALTLSRDTVLASKIGGTAGTTKMTLAGMAIVSLVVPSEGMREKLTADRDYYVRYNFGVCTMTIASPAVVTRAGHGLAAGDPVVFHLPYDASQADTSPTISIASPGVVTFAGHGYSADDPVLLRTSSALPTGLTPETVYFVRNPTTDTFELSATAGGASINTTGSFTDYLKVERASSLPTGVVEGQIYYVLATDLSTDTFKFSETVGGAAVNTSGTQAGKITLQTGNDANSGLVNTQSDALLTPMAAFDLACALDSDDFSVTIHLNDSKYLIANEPVINILRDAAGLSSPPRNTPIGGGRIYFLGNEGNRSNVVLAATGAAPVQVYGNYDDLLQFRMFTTESDGTGFYPGFNLLLCENPPYVEHIQFRGTPSSCIELYNASCTLHGMMEVIGDPSIYVFSAAQEGYLSYVATGQDYFPGLIAFGAKTAFSILGATGGRIDVNSTIQWEGDFSGVARYYVDRGGKIVLWNHATASIESVGDAPVLRGGSVHTRITGGYYESQYSLDYSHVFPRTVANLPSAGTAGRRAFVTDANATTFASVVAGGGSNNVPVYDDGTNWRIG